MKTQNTLTAALETVLQVTKPGVREYAPSLHRFRRLP